MKRLSSLGVIESAIDLVIKEATAFIGTCYGIESGYSMSEKRYNDRIVQFF